MAHRRFGQPERSLTVQRHRDERGHARSRTRARDRLRRGPSTSSSRSMTFRTIRSRYRRALGAHCVGAARTPRGWPGTHAPAREATGGLEETTPAHRPAAEPPLRRLTRGATCRPPREPPRSSAAWAACSTGAPRTRKRPPNAIAQMQNHAHPNASPAMTSDSQWTPRRTRLHATPTAIATAPPASRARVEASAAGPSPARRPRRSRRQAGVAARERRPERLGDRVERGPDAVENPLDRVHQGDLPGDDRHKEDRNPPVRDAANTRRARRRRAR